MSIPDLDRTLNARAVCEFRGRSLPTLNRDIREGRFPPPDFTVGQWRYWKFSTVIRAREREIGEAAANAAALRRRHLEDAERARAARARKRAERAALAIDQPKTA